MLVTESTLEDHVIVGFNVIKEVIANQSAISDNFMSSLKSSFKGLSINSVSTFVQLVQDSDNESPVSLKTAKNNVLIKRNQTMKVSCRANLGTVLSPILLLSEPNDIETWPAGLALEQQIINLNSTNP